MRGTWGQCLPGGTLWSFRVPTQVCVLGVIQLKTPLWDGVVHNKLPPYLTVSMFRICHKSECPKLRLELCLWFYEQNNHTYNGKKQYMWATAIIWRNRIPPPLRSGRTLLSFYLHHIFFFLRKGLKYSKWASNWLCSRGPSSLHPASAGITGVQLHAWFVWHCACRQALCQRSDGPTSLVLAVPLGDSRKWGECYVFRCSCPLPPIGHCSLAMLHSQSPPTLEISSS